MEEEEEEEEEEYNMRRNNTAVVESYIKVDHSRFFSVHFELPLS